MKILILIGIIAAVAADLEIHPAITSSGITVSGEFPSAVFIRGPTTMPQPLCGGTVIDRQHILTSAQCVLNAQNQLINPFWFEVVAGDINMVRARNQRLVRRVSRIFVHSGYVASMRNNDLAVMRLAELLPELHNSMEPALLNTAIPAPGAACRLVGWGAATNVATALIQPEQRAMNAPVITHANCNVNTVHANQVLNTHLCAGSITTTNPQTGACRGNIGSGLYCNDRLAGVLSFGQSCGGVNQPGVYVDVRQYIDWINNQLVRTDNPQPGSIPS